MRAARARRSLKRGASSPHANWRRPGPTDLRGDATLLCRRRFSCGRGPPGLVGKLHRRWRLPRPARRRHNRHRGDREGGEVRGPGLAAAVVAGALQAGVANLENGPISPLACRKTPGDLHLQPRAGRRDADPPSFETTVLSWSPCDTIPLGPNGTLQVVRVRDNDEPGRPADDEALF